MSSRALAKLGKSVTAAGKFDNSAFEASVATPVPTQYANEDLLPDSDLLAGQTGFVISNNGYYVSDGTTWYQIGFDATNASPSINSVTFGDGWNIDSDVYYFDSDLSKTYTITINATDSDNLPLSFSLDSNTTFNQYATAIFDRNVATISLNDSNSSIIVTDLQVKARDAFDADVFVLPSIRFTRTAE